MRRTLLLLSTLLVAISAAAAPVDVESLRTYARRSMTRCPDAIITLSPVPAQGPANFLTYQVNLKSSDEQCTARKYLLFSPATQQVVMGTVFVLPEKGTLTQRVSSTATDLMKVPVTATVGGFPLPDGLKAATMTKQTRLGPFAYHGFVDAAERFLIVGTRGNLRTDPGQTFLQAIGAENAVHRGNPAKVEILELSDFECPTCGAAHKRLEPIISKNLSKVNYARLDLPLFETHEWSFDAAMGARAIQKVAPSKYWEYVNYVFSNQEMFAKLKYDKFFHDYCDDHDIPWAKIAPIYTSKTERRALIDQVSRAFDNTVMATPTFIINGQMVAYGPGGDYVVAAIKSAMGIK